MYEKISDEDKYRVATCAARDYMQMAQGKYDKIIDLNFFKEHKRKYNKRGYFNNKKIKVELNNGRKNNF